MRLPRSPAAEHRVRWGTAEAAVGTAVALILVSFVGPSALRTWSLGAEASIALSYLAVWVPLLGAVLVASYLRGRRSLRLNFGLRFTWLDVLYGLILGLFLRSVATLIEFLGYGQPAGGAVTFGPVNYNLVWLLLTIIAPVLIAPLIEELFFRGLVQRAVLKASARSQSEPSRISTVIAVAVSSLLFAVVHMLQTQGGAQLLVVGVTTLILGISVGMLAAITGRLGGAIIAHAVFNGLGVVGGLL